MRKALGDIIILHKCTKTHDHILSCSWDMACGRYNYFSFWAIFCPFTPLTTQKWKFQKKNERNVWRYHFLTQLYQKSWSYVLLFLRYSTWQMQLLFFGLGYFLPFYPTNSPKNENFKKMKKTCGEIIIFHMCMIFWCIVPEIWCATEKVTYRGGYPT